VPESSTWFTGPCSW